MTSNPDAIIVGAGPAGLACAAMMRGAGLNASVVEKAGNVGAVWRRHYDRLHLHTDRNHSGLPGMAMPPDYPAYPSREQVVAYLENYAARFEIKPIFNTTVSSIRRDGANWRADTSQGAITAPVVVVATGIADAPYRPAWPGSATYSGRDDPQQRIRQSGTLRGQARAGGRLRQFRRRDRARSCECRRRCRTGGPRSRSDPAARSARAFRFCPGRSCTGGCPRAWSTSSTRRYYGLRSATSKASDCAALQRARGRWSRKMAACR